MIAAPYRHQAVTHSISHLIGIIAAVKALADRRFVWQFSRQDFVPAAPAVKAFRTLGADGM